MMPLILTLVKNYPIVVRKKFRYDDTFCVVLLPAKNFKNVRIKLFVVKEGENSPLDDWPERPELYLEL